MAALNVAIPDELIKAAVMVTVKKLNQEVSMSLATLISLPFIVIIAIFFVATIINVVKGDHVFKSKYSSKHGKEANSNE